MTTQTQNKITRRPTFRYLSGEGKRNRANADLFQAMLHIAWGEGVTVITGHHVSFLFDGDLATEDEIPSADCLLFDHDVMATLFPADYTQIMVELAPLGRYERENRMRELMIAHHPECGLEPKIVEPPQ